MKYGELVEFTPVQSVKQLRDAVSADQALEDVQTYVISETMRDQLANLVLPNLRFDNPDHDHKGLLLIATYGTGKTHLMSAVASVAERAELLPCLTDAGTQEAAGPVAGRFKVLRVEIGAVTTNLRTILTNELTRGLADLGIEYTFPSADGITNNKAALEDMMAAFEAAYPDQGLLLAIDEMLDYLRGRKDAEIILDLGFLRELGEFTRNSRFRILAGVQESLFDNPRFDAAKSELQRVSERYQTFRIHRDDIAYVVQKRLLAKTAEQKARIREHLTKFSAAFESLGKDLETFVDLFPVHPAYLKVFEDLTLVEKRRILSSLTQQLRQRLDVEVPTDEPGLVCFDAYRAELDEDPTNRSNPEVRSVLEPSRVVRDLVMRNLEAGADREPALRILDALTIHRLTTYDLDAPIGLTYADLRDDLCLVPPGVPELEADFLEMSVETLVGEIRKAATGQFISVNESNGQVYLDLNKNVAYDEQIDQRVESIDDEALDRAYFDLLAQVLEVTDAPYVSGYKIWSYQLPWAAKKVERTGYLFFGAPNQRSTAQPARDFYLYFLHPFDPVAFNDEEKSDEIFFQLEDPAEAFTTALGRYAAANAKAAETSGETRQGFLARAQKFGQEAVKWLRDNLSSHVKVTYQGERKPLAEWLAGVPGGRRTLKEQLEAIAAAALSPHFDARYPGYPVFAEQLTAANLANAVQNALGTVASKPTNLGKSVLTSLGLRDYSETLTLDGQYAKALLDVLNTAAPQAVNREKLLAERDPGVETWAPWHLEPAWLTVVGAVLTALGRADLTFRNGTKITALNLDELARMPLTDLEGLAFLQPPATTDTAGFVRLATLLGLPPALGQSELTPESATHFLERSQTIHDEVLSIQSYVQSHPRLWGEEVIDDPDTRLRRLRDALDLLSDVRARDNVGKLKRFSFKGDVLDRAEAGHSEAKRLTELRKVADQLGPEIEYLKQAGDVLGQHDPFDAEAEAVKDKLRRLLRTDPSSKSLATEVRHDAQRLRTKYRQFADERHQAVRLSPSDEQTKEAATKGPYWRDLTVLQGIEIIPDGQFGKLQEKIVGLYACKQYEPKVYDSGYSCPYCSYRPSPSNDPAAKVQLTKTIEEAKNLWATWTTHLTDSLTDAEIQERLDLLSAGERTALAPLTNGTLAPGEVTPALVSAVQQVLDDLQVVPLSADDLAEALFPGGRATTPAQAASAFQTWLERVTRENGGNASTIRLKLEGTQKQ
ncbi:DUF6079 family protein [Nocardioides sp. Soil805]|uniref:DUF6079 family protein n=1 Tax=Nocardioides sp. Soil805 TaxID=1736416 RepID=UPI000702BB2E|nr:DUF6079 family protein [Nocardioides sp. Soil805]KRF37390.1 hypothetical protein ASG94_08695 [Nocardioides sp. Soil805]